MTIYFRFAPILCASLIASQSLAGLSDVRQMMAHSGGGWDVDCNDGRRQVATTTQVQSGFVCDEYSVNWAVVGQVSNCTADTCAFEDRSTALEWSPYLGSRNMRDGHHLCNSLTTLGHTDWRLPTFSEYYDYYRSLWTVAAAPNEWYGANSASSWVLNANCAQHSPFGDSECLYYDRLAYGMA